MDKQKCKLCKQTLVPIGEARKNGKNHAEWYSREYHKKCYKDAMLFMQIRREQKELDEFEKIMNPIELKD